MICKKYFRFKSLQRLNYVHKVSPIENVQEGLRGKDFGEKNLKLNFIYFIFDANFSRITIFFQMGIRDKLYHNQISFGFPIYWFLFFIFGLSVAMIWTFHH